MRSDLYCQLASVINGNYGWLRVSEGKTYDIQSVCVHKRTYPVVCRTLVLRAAFANDPYPKGMVFKIALKSCAFFAYCIDTFDHQIWREVFISPFLNMTVSTCLQSFFKFEVNSAQGEMSVDDFSPH